MHISELAQQHVENPREIVQPGDEVKVKILEIDSERRRLSLSIKRVEGQVLPRRTARPATPATSRTCPSWACPRTSSPTRPAAEPPRATSRRRGRGAEAEPRPRSPRPPEAEAVEEARRSRGRRGAEATAEVAEARGRRARRRSPRPRRPPEPEAAAETPEPEAEEETDRAAVRRPDGRHRRGEVGGARRAGAPRRGDDVRRRGRPRALRGSGGPRRRRRPLGAEVAPGGSVDRAAVARRAFATPTRSAGGSRAALAARRAQRIAEWRATSPRASRRRPRWWWRRRCCSRRGWRPRYDATIAVVADEDGAGASGPAPAATRRSTSGPPASSRQAEKAAPSDVRCRELRHARRLGAGAVGGSCEAEPVSAAAHTTRTASRRRGRRRARPRARRRLRAARPVAARRVVAIALLTLVSLGRQGGAGDQAPAAPRGHHPPAGGRQGRRPVADRRRHLHRVALPRPDLARRRQGPDAADAGDRRLHRPQVRRHAVRAGRPRDAADQHRLRHLVPALPARASTTATRSSRSPPTTPGRARSTSGGARRPPAARSSRSPSTSRSRRRATTCSRCSARATSTATSTRTSSASNVSAMNQRPLGRTGLQVSEIGYGAWGIGQSMWLGAEDDESVQALNRADRPGRDLLRHRPRATATGTARSSSARSSRERDEVVVATKIPPKNMRWPAPDGIDPDDAFPADYVDRVDRAEPEQPRPRRRRRPAVPRLVRRVGRPRRAGSTAIEQLKARRQDPLLRRLDQRPPAGERDQADRERRGRHRAGDLQRLRPVARGRAARRVRASTASASSSACRSTRAR